ncbi:hypothetical protein RchiOBHm_Chr4g0428381 [Rosa chinensis]|uniref:DUF4228 domain protein n=1 Tax=Rosa chinensis TaxID=74649 RepID=A0A2P6R025_ROSCH|nr:uncharacterized protein LOC112199824 [Rosa chinensis]PRQ39729.1 hypothetical protein RchiOBHm_Chr4g0428381 [Rosa chinensis]
MGVRFFTLQMIPMCFHVTGNHHVSSCVQLQPDDDEEEYQPPRAKLGGKRAKISGKRAVVGTIKVVKSDGLVKIYNKPIDVSELMRQFPKHLVCASDSFYIGQKIPALSEHDQLQLGRKYFLLPKHFFQTVLSFVTIASFATSGPESEPEQKPSPVPSTNSKNAFLRKAANCEPFHIQKSESGCLRIRVSDEFISQLLEEGKLSDEAKVEEEDEHGKSIEPNNSKVCTTPQLQKDYSQLVGSRQWKPRLEPIRETRETKRRSRLSSFGMRRSKKKSQPNSSKATQSSKGPKSPKIATLVKSEHHSKTKIKIKSSKK